MAVTAFASGSQAATVTTEHFVADVNVAGVFTFHVDTSVMQANDVLELRVYQMELASGTARVVYFGMWAGVQPTNEANKVSLPISNELTDSTALRFSLKQTFGTTRTYPWKVLKHA